jgi:hypothetical protein
MTFGEVEILNEWVSEQVITSPSKNHVGLK